MIPNAGRDDLAQLFAELGYQSGAEIGVERAKFTEVLCKANPDAMIYGVDSWESYRGYRDHVGQEKLDGFYAVAQERLVPYNCTLIRKFSMDALEDFEDGSLDFVYIDANHTLPFVMRDIIEWTKKVRKGGIISGHDYRRSKRHRSQNHVPYAVECYTQAYRIKPWYLWGRRERVEGEVRDDSRSWMWVRRWP